MAENAKPEPDTTSPFGDRRANAASRLAWKVATARSFASPTRRRVRKFVAPHYPGPFDLIVDGIRLRTYPAENHCDRTIVGRRTLPEAPERSLIAPLLSHDMVFVDIGANIGVYSLFVSARTRGHATVVAFEPHPRSFTKLEFNCAINGFANIACINAAVGPEEGHAPLFTDGGGNAGGASLRAEAGVAKVVTKVAVTPLARTLAALGINRIDLLKIDVEGFEDEALMPFFQFAHRRLWPTHILLETVHAGIWKRDVADFLGRNGYRVSGKTPENQLYAKVEV